MKMKQIVLIQLIQVNKDIIVKIKIILNMNVQNQK